MVKKQIKKFFNSVPMQENMLAWADERKQNSVPFAWIAVGLLIGLSVLIGAFLLMKAEFSDSEAD